MLLARDLINTAPNDLFPQSFADRATAAAEAAGLSVEVLDENPLAKEGYGGILAVGSGSTRPPRLVRISYSPGQRQEVGGAGRQGHHLRFRRDCRSSRRRAWST